MPAEFTTWQDKIEEAQEEAFEELEYEECTDDQCIMMIQEILQVENVFTLQIVADDVDSQLSLTWDGLQRKKGLNRLLQRVWNF